MKIILHDQIREQIAPQLPADIEVCWVDADGVFAGDPADAAVYFRWWTNAPAFAKAIAAATSVRWLHTPSAGVDHVLIPPVLERDILVTNSAGVHAIPIAEFVMALLLSHLKRLPYFRDAQAEARWDRDLPPDELYEKTLYIVGIGGIGQAIAQRAASFGVRVVASRRTPRPMDGIDRVVGMDEWRELLPEADAIVLAAPLTDETRGMIDAAAFAAMKPSAYLINIARGAIIDEPALIDAVNQGRIAGAALDTFEQEPLQAESPLWRLSNVTITPHTTAFSPRMRQRQISFFVDNLRRYLNGEPLLNVVDKTLGY